MKTVELKCGRLEYLDTGEGEPLLLLHGLLTNSSNWDRVIADLSQYYRCIAPTLPLGAHHVPLTSTADLTPTGIASILDEFLNVLNVPRAVLVGNDTGGAYAQVFTAEYPDRVSALVLSSCDALEVFPPPQFSALQKSIDVPLFTEVLSLVFRLRPLLNSRWILGLLSYKLTGSEIFDKYLKYFVRDQSVRLDFKKVVRALLPHYTQAAAAQLAHLRKPTLLLWASEDKLFPVSLAERLKKMLVDAQLVLVDESLSYIQVDQPELFVKHVLEFIKTSSSNKKLELASAGAD